ncbi:hypothetical protein N7462_003929 [Penicillium macrosclerotiorum]|uniref:uncharacterized protein n=1 Tax=Penicillium macrosclerotiorum TaxID=303699 RepID=UPI0025478CDE|nr:uncharacterized protein N7462_003929 [Penicillium macrosclerotiorum]KAJ5689537.1 hypothetical protein N7462_003929 [Penicillium macrosclerotiorum]
MSDDDEYYEWDDEYLLEDLVPDLVDELAGTSYYEAALYEDPAMDVEDYFSDWEYYSDDYHDDDPTVKHNPAVVKEIDASTKPRRSAGSRTNNRLGPPKSTLKPDVTTFQGVIWRTPNLEKDQDIAVQIYEPGHGDKVALLEDWREIFKFAQPALDKSRLRKRKAMDTSLVEPSFADDEFPCEEEYDPADSSDQMSDILSLENTTDNGDASNTTPELIQSPKEVPSPVVTAPAKRGRKRKAEVSPEEEHANEASGKPPRTRTKRLASKNEASTDVKSDPPPSRVRRSTRRG